MKRTGRRRVSKGNVFAGVVALLAFGGVVAAPFLFIKAGQAVVTERNRAAYARADHLGRVARDGSMSFVVDSVHCGVAKIGNLTPARGQFCVYGMTVADNGKQPIRFDAISQRAFGSKGGFYVPDPAADAALNHASDTIPDAIGDPNHEAEAGLRPRVAPPLTPGASRTVQIVYDIPLDVKITKINLHANEQTTGIEVLF